ncbi:hypothetical protein [Pseudomonas aeruginosa]|nr:hypothetical protein [Pseudomonas aeruginosa]
MDDAAEPWALAIEVDSEPLVLSASPSSSRGFQLNRRPSFFLLT